MSVLFNFLYFKMHLPECFFLLILMMIADECLSVSGSDLSVSAYVGDDITLSCSVDPHIPPKEIEEVSWRKTDKDGVLLVLLYQNNEALPEASDERYRDRVEFFTDEIHRGNFSLRLKRVRTEDKGVYVCQVFAGGLSANTTVVLERLGLSAPHILVLILCVTACVSAPLCCYLIYCRSNTGVYLQMFLFFCPNIIMFFAFVFWGVSEGFLNETVTCCALFFLRPLMLLWSFPKANDFPDNIKHMAFYSFRLEYILFTSVLFSVLFTYIRNRLLNYTALDTGMITVLFVIMSLMCLITMIDIFVTVRRSVKLNIIAFISFDILPPLQLILLFYAFGVARGTFLIAGVLPVIVIVARFDWNYICGNHGLRCSQLVIRTMFLIFTLLMNVLLACFYCMVLEKEEDRAGWTCLIVFLQILWAINNFRRSFNRWGVKSNAFVRLFASVGVVLISAVSLMTELILKTVNGEHWLRDLRITVFSSESFCALCLLILQIYDTSNQPHLLCQDAFTQKYYSRDRSHQPQSQEKPRDEETETESGKIRLSGH